jgi:YD repeat-containing protein
MRPFAILISMIVFFQSHAQTADEQKNKDAIVKNKVRNQISWDYKYSGEKPAASGVKTSVTTYTAKGDIALVNAYNTNAQVINVEKYTYDTRGNKIEYTREAAENSYQKKWIYNEKNLLVEESGFDGVENFRNLYSYNAGGEMTEIRYLKPTALKEKRMFSKTGNTTTVSVMNPSGVTVSRVILKYDDAGNLLEETMYGVNQNELEKKTYNYDDNENLKEEAKYKLSRVTLKTTYTYNSAGMLSEVSEESPGTPRFVKKSMGYDANGNLILLKWRKKSTEAFNTISYVYGASGLCTSMETNYPATKYRVLTKYTYEYY